MDLSTTTEPKSDQQNFDDYIAGPKVVTITEVKAGNSEQPVEVHLAEFPGRPYKPSKSMRRVLVAAWGKDSSVYAGRRMILVGDPDVKFGGEKVGGIKIAALSDIEDELRVSLTVTRGKRAPHIVKPYIDLEVKKPSPTDAMLAAYESLGVTRSQLEAHVALPVDEWGPEVLDALKVLGGQIKSGEATVADVFGASE